LAEMQIFPPGKQSINAHFLVSSWKIQYRPFPHHARGLSCRYEYFRCCGTVRFHGCCFNYPFNHTAHAWKWNHFFFPSFRSSWDPEAGRRNRVHQPSQRTWSHISQSLRFPSANPNTLLNSFRRNLFRDYLGHGYPWKSVRE
jgi:hypothetical protein